MLGLPPLLARWLLLADTHHAATHAGVRRLIDAIAMALGSVFLALTALALVRLVVSNLPDTHPTWLVGVNVAFLGLLGLALPWHARIAGIGIRLPSVYLQQRSAQPGSPTIPVERANARTEATGEGR